MALHLVEGERQACRLAIAAESAARVSPIDCPDWRSRWMDLDHENRAFIQFGDLNSRRLWWQCSIRNERLHAYLVRPAGLVSRPGAGDTAVILHADEEPAWPPTGPVR